MFGLPIPSSLEAKALALIVTVGVAFAGGTYCGFRFEKASFATYKAAIEQAKAAEIAAEFQKQKVFDDIAINDARRDLARQASIAAETRRQLEEFHRVQRNHNSAGCPDDAGRALGVLKRAFPSDQGAGLPAPAGGADGSSPPVRSRTR